MYSMVTGNRSRDTYEVKRAIFKGNFSQRYFEVFPFIQGSSDTCTHCCLQRRDVCVRIQSHMDTEISYLSYKYLYIVTHAYIQYIIFN